MLEAITSLNHSKCHPETYLASATVKNQVSMPHSNLRYQGPKHITTQPSHTRPGQPPTSPSSPYMYTSDPIIPTSHIQRNLTLVMRSLARLSNRCSSFCVSTGMGDSSSQIILFLSSRDRIIGSSLTSFQNSLTVFLLFLPPRVEQGDSDCCWGAAGGAGDLGLLLLLVSKFGEDLGTIVGLRLTPKRGGGTRQPGGGGGGAPLAAPGEMTERGMVLGLWRLRIGDV